MVGAEVVVVLVVVVVNATGSEGTGWSTREADETFDNGNAPNVLDCSGFLLTGIPLLGYRMNDPQ